MKDLSTVTPLKAVALASKVCSTTFFPLSHAAAALQFLLIITQAALIHFSVGGFIEIGHDLTTGMTGLHVSSCDGPRLSHVC